MHREGHLGAALALYAPIGFVAFVLGWRELAILGVVGAAGLAMLPDQDQRVPLIKHRGITHTVWFAALVGLVLGGIGAAYGLQDGILAGIGTAVFGFVVGTVTIGSHILADSLTPMGVRPLAPMRSHQYSLGVAKAANPFANYLLLVLGGGLTLGFLILASVLTG